jgi:quinol monooxygenase YgiN
MIVRVVRLKFSKENLPLALDKLNAIAPTVRSMKGCSYLEIASGLEHRGMVFTYSHWDSVQSLNAYRTSETFKAFWRDIKTLFSEPAGAWSLDPLVELK